MAVDVVCPALVARQDEWTALLGALDAAVAGRGGLTALVGEAGIGKSRLVTELQGVARDRGLAVLTGRAVDAGAPVAFRPLFEALSGYFRTAGPDEHGALAPLQDALAPLVPEWRRADGPTFKPSAVELGEALVRLLAGIAVGRGCLLVLEDLHWADHDTAAVLEYVGDNLPGTGVACVVSVRPEGNGGVLHVVRALGARRSATILELQRLRRDELIEMTGLCLGAAALTADVDELVQRFADGLPFLVEELLGSAISSGSLVDGPEGWRVEPGRAPAIPRGFDDLVRRRIAELSEDEAAIVNAAAILGSSFDAELLPVVTGRPIEAIVPALRRGIGAQLLVADPTDPRLFAFRHALTRDALLAQLLPFEHVALARQVRVAIEQHQPDLPGELCELAATLAEQAGDGERAAELLLRAAQRAVARGALSTAEPMLDRAWRWARREHPSWTQIADLLIAVLSETGETDRALEVGGRRLAELPAADDRAAIHLAMARAAAAAGRWAVATSALERARDEGALAGEADGIAAEVAAGEFRYDDAEHLATAALTAAEAVDDAALACTALLVLGRCARNRNPEEAAHVFDRVIELGRAKHQPTFTLRGLMERASLEIWRFRPDTDIAVLRDQAMAAGALIVAAHLDNFATWSARDHHLSERAEAASARAADLARKMRLHTLHAVTVAAGALAAGQRGDRELMERRLAEAHAIAGDHLDVRSVTHAARAAYWASRDDLPRLGEELDEAMHVLRQTPGMPMPERGQWALVRAVQDRDAEASVAELEAGGAIAHAMNDAYRHYARAVLAGRAGDAEAVARHMALADDSAPPEGWFRHHARRLVAEAAVAEGWGDPVPWLREAEAYFDDRGETAIAASCRRLLGEAGAAPPRRTSRPAGVPQDLHDRGVSARELEVLELLATASPTKDIAAQLFLSPKTVERHIANLATKLGVGGRSGLVALAAARFGAAPIA